MKKNTSQFGLVLLLLVFGISKLNAQSPCDADHTVLLIDYEFSPSELIIAPGETPLTLTVGARSFAKDWVRASKPALLRL